MFAYSTLIGMWVQAIGLFAQVTCAPEFGLPRPFNQRLLVLHVGGVAVKQQIKLKTNKLQNKNKKGEFKKKKKSIWLTVFQLKKYTDIHVTPFYHSWKFVFLREKWVIKNKSHLT